MIVIAAAAVVAGSLLAFAPWRVPARDVRPDPRPSAPSRIIVGGPTWGAAVAATAIVVHPIVAAPIVLWPTGHERWRRRRESDEGRRAAVRALPEATELIALGIGAGSSVRGAVDLARPWVDEPFRSAFADAARRADAGEPFGHALRMVAHDLDPVARPLVGLLAAAAADGGGLLGGLARLGDEGRRRRRANAAVRARRLPITMLLPLVLCVLPAFGLLAVAPMVLTALGQLDLGL